MNIEDMYLFGEIAAVFVFGFFILPKIIGHFYKKRNKNSKYSSFEYDTWKENNTYPRPAPPAPLRVYNTHPRAISPTPTNSLNPAPNTKNSSAPLGGYNNLPNERNDSGIGDIVTGIVIGEVLSDLTSNSKDSSNSFEAGGGSFGGGGASGSWDSSSSSSSDSSSSYDSGSSSSSDF